MPNRNGKVNVGDTDMYYVSFGIGPKTLVVLPGLSDGLATVKGKALILSSPYKKYLTEYTVFMFSRKNKMPEGYSIRDMAADQVVAMKALGIGKADVMGVSQGGMIAQYIAIDHPEVVDRLILTVTAPYANDTVRSCVASWIEMAKRGDHKEFMTDTAKKTYSDAYLAKNLKMMPLVAKFTKPKDYGRFFINANAILGSDARDLLPSVNCPTLIIAGDCDKTVGVDAHKELISLIPGSELLLYPGLGHGLYEEADDFYDKVFEYLRK